MDKEVSAKSFLREHKLSCLKIKTLEKKIEELYGSDVRSPQGSDGQPRGSGTGDPAGALAAKIADMRSETEWLWDQQQKIRRKIERTLYMMTDPDAFQVAWLRYIELEDWQQIAEELDKTVRTVQRIHKKSLLEVQEILDKQRQEQTDYKI
jgi:hypothetical protein